MGISPHPLKDFNEEKFGMWLERHQQNTAMHFPTVDDDDNDDEGCDNEN